MAGRPMWSSAPSPRQPACGRSLDLPSASLIGASMRLSPRAFQPDAVHRLAEQLAVLGHVDGFGLGADQLDAEALERALLVERQRRVERGLPAHRRQQSVGAFGRDDLGDDVRRDRLDVGCIGQIRVGHDRGRIRIDQNDPIALGLQRLAGLGPGIVELAGLTDDDRAGADDEDGS